MGKYTSLLTCFILILILKKGVGQGDPCLQNDFFGHFSPPTESKTIGLHSASASETVLMFANTVDCCGVTEMLTINSNSMTAATMTAGLNWIEFHVYRPDGTGSYTLVYAEMFSGLGQSNSLPLVPGGFVLYENDVIGFKSEAGVITYGDRNTDDQGNMYYTLANTPVGTTVGGASGTPLTAIARASYALKLDVDASTSPTVTTPDANINNDAASGVSIITVTASDIDTYDNGNLWLQMTSCTPTPCQFSFDNTTGIITTGTITAETDTEHEMVFTVQDLCGQIVTGTSTVTITNVPPSFTNLPDHANITEGATTITCLFTPICTDTVSTSFTYTYTGADPFIVRYGSSICFDGIGTLDYNTQSTYILAITCSDGDKTDTQTLTVYVERNTPPSLTNLQGQTNVSVTAGLGTFVFQALVSNPETTDILDFSMTLAASSPAVCSSYFEILDNGWVRTTQDLSATTVTAVSCEFDITVSDGFNTDTNRLTVSFVDFDAAMSCQNTPTNRTVFENTALGTSVFTVVIADSDNPPQAKTFSLDGVQADALLYFSISQINDTHALIQTANNILDYEAVSATTYNLVVGVVDSRMTLYCSLDVYISNKCEPPVLDSTTYTLTGSEGPALQSLGIPTIVVSDPDAGETLTYTMDCGNMNGFVSMDSSTLEVKFRSDYDVDGAANPTSISCIVTVTDSCGETDNATLTINIANINDNIPLFAQSAYSFLLYPCSAVTIGTSIGTVPATDADDSPYNSVTLSVVSSQDSASFHISQAGVITAVRELNCSTSYSIQVTATDQNGNSSTVTVSIVVSATTPAPTTTVSYEYMGFWDDYRNYIWFVPLVLILAITLGVLCWTAFTCHGEQGCRAVLARLRGGRKLRFRPTGNGNFSWHTVRKPPPAKHTWTQM